MSRYMLRVAMMLATTLVASSMAPANDARAAELKVVASVALASALNELTPTFERATGNKLVIDYGLAANIRKNILDGEAADVVILTRLMMEELQKQDKIMPGSLVNVGGTAVAVVARAGAPKPDINSVDALKHALQSAKSIVYADPAKGGLSGVYFARVLDRLGLAEQLKAKTILVPGAQAAEVVARGEAELGVAQASEIVDVKGAQLVGPLPGDLGTVTVFTAGIGATTKSSDAANALLQFFTGPAAATLLKAKGFAPG
jgi:molybdate transport system substrate-binding protein